ncbi:MAG: histidine kinase [Ignavibacteriaceae bacterium]
MKKFLSNSAILIIGALLVQIPVALNIYIYFPGSLNYVVFDTLIIAAYMFPLAFIFNYSINKGLKVFVVVSTLIIFSGPAFVYLIGMPVRIFILGESTSYVNGTFFLDITRKYFVFYLYLTCIFLVNYYWTEYKKQKDKALKATALANEAQLKMLQYQVNPHFLFNSLNAIQSMIEKDKDRAKEMIAELSDFFRHTLSHKNQVFISLKEEMDAVQKYLSIQKERFAERLQVSLEIDNKSLDAKIPSFLIHPLVENSIKYGFSAENKNLHLYVRSEKVNGTLTIVVKNSGTLKKEDQFSVTPSGTKTGIENIKKRLDLLYPGLHEFELSENDGWVKARIVIKSY